jgi:predicted PurR-regulated permease PerM
MVLRTLSVLATVALVLAVGALIHAAPKTVIVLVLAVFFAYLLEPLVKASAKWARVSRAGGVAITYLGLLGVLGLLAWTAGPSIMQQTEELRKTLPSLVGQIASGQIAESLGEEHRWSPETIEHVRLMLADHRETIASQTRKFHHYVSDLGQNITWILMIPVLALFFLSGKEDLGRTILHIADAGKSRPVFRRFIHGMDKMLSRYIRAKLLLVVAAMAAYTLFLPAIGMPFGLAIGVITGVLEFIPVFGPLLSLGIQLGIAAAVNFGHLILLAGYWVVFRGIQDVVIMPKVMDRQLKLPPLLSIVGVLMGGEAAGVLGMFLSIPVIMTARVLWQSAVPHGSVRRVSTTHAVRRERFAR